MSDILKLNDLYQNLVNEYERCYRKAATQNNDRFSTCSAYKYESPELIEATQEFCEFFVNNPSLLQKFIEKQHSKELKRNPYNPDLWGGNYGQ